jgi:hypothetical protein
MLNANFPISATPDVLKAMLKKCTKSPLGKSKLIPEESPIPFRVSWDVADLSVIDKKRAKSCQPVEHGEPLY